MFFDRRDFAHVVTVPNELNLSYQKGGSPNGLDLVRHADRKQKQVLQQLGGMRPHLVLASWAPLRFHMDFRMNFSISARSIIVVSARYCIESVDNFEGYHHIKNIKSFNP